MNTKLSNISQHLQSAKSPESNGGGGPHMRMAPESNGGGGPHMSMAPESNGGGGPH